MQAGGKTYFENAVIAAKSLQDRPDNENMLLLYGLYKQATTGDINVAKPGFFDFVGVAKFEAWEKLRGTSPDEAKSSYVEMVRKLGGAV